MATILQDLRHDGTPVTLSDPYGRTLLALAETGMVNGRAGDYLIGVLHDRPTGRYEAGGGSLTWREPAPDATVRLDVAVADTADGRFVPGLTVYVAAERNGRTYAPTSARSAGIRPSTGTPPICACRPEPTT